MIKEWSRLNYDTQKFGLPSWRKLAEAVATMDKKLSHSIADEHPVETGGASNQACSIDQKHEEEATATSDIKQKPKPAFEIDDEVLSIHSLTLSECGFSESECKKLKHRIRADSMAIIVKYELLSTKFQCSLERRGIPVKKLATHLQGFKAFDPVYAHDDNQIFAEDYETLKNVRDIEEALSLVRKYSSFFSYQILKQLILKLGTKDDKEELEKYEKAFHEYAKRRLFECPSKFGFDTGQAKIFITLDRAFKDSTLSHLILLTKNLCEIFGISITGVLRLYSISGGSIKLIYLVPHYVQKSVFPLSEEQEQALEKLQVKCHIKTSNTHQMVSEHYNVIVL